MTTSTRHRLILIFISGFSYFMGVGIARYLGYNIEATKALLGAIWILAIAVCSSLLREIRFSKVVFLREDNKPKINLYLYLLIGFTTLIAVSMGFYITKGLNINIFSLYGITIILGLLYIFLDENAEAFADLLIVVYISYIIPYTAYILQSGKDHPLIILNAFYLIFVILSYVSLNELSEYKSTRATRKMTKIIDLTGYRGGILFHNFLLIFAYLACAMLFFWGLPKNVYFPIFLTIPFSGYHVWKMLKLLEVEGDTFSWKRAIILHLFIMFSLLYFPAYGYWMR